MKQKKSFSKVDYYLFLIEEYKDQFTIVICFNILIDFILSHLDNSFKTMYFKNNLDITFINATQFDMSMFLEFLGYVYLASFFLHLVTYKANQYWIFIANSTMLVIISNLMYFSFTLEGISFAIKDFYWPLILCLIGQLILNCIWGNEIYHIIQQKIIRNTDHT